MKNVFDLFDNIIKKSIKNSELKRTAKILSDLTDKQLQDVGISRKKLNLGASAYPWKLS